MSTTELNEELETVISAHDLTEEHAARVRELVDEGVPVLDAIRQAGEAEPPEETPTKPTPAPTAELTEPTEAMLRALGKQVEKNDAAVRKIMGGFVDGFEPCHACDGVGLEQPGPKPRSHEFFAACATCNGYGQVITGSLVDGRTGTDCPDCGGRGYLELLLDNTPAMEIVKQIREQRRAVQPEPVVLLEPPAPAGAEPALTMGRPAWMGDPNLSA